MTELAFALNATQVWRLVALAAAFTVLGMAAQVMWVYAAKVRHEGGALNWHVALIAASYCLSILALFASHLISLEDNDPIGPRLVIAFPGYVVGIVALAILLRDLKHRG